MFLIKKMRCAFGTILLLALSGFAEGKPNAKLLAEA